MSHWAIDLGTSNTVIARWDAASETSEVIRLKAICRDPDGLDPLAAPGVVPSSTHMVHETDLWTSVGRWPMVRTRVFWGRHAIIGQPAIEKNISTHAPAYLPSFKGHLQHQASKPVARAGGQSFTARDVARAFLRELLAEIERQTGERVRELTVTCPVDAYEGYRAEVRELFRTHGVRVKSFVDEPVAAAAGYGLSVRGERKVLVVDFGGGTLDLALVAIDARSVESGTGRVLAKAGRPIGGNLVDRWLLDDVARRLSAPLPTEDEFWLRLLLDEARWVKEQVFLKDSEPFQLRPPGDGSVAAARMGRSVPEVTVTREDLVACLTAHRLYEQLTEVTDEVLAKARADGLLGDPDDVLMVGGSTLLPGVFPHFEARFGRDRVRAWQPFSAVAQGACTLSARGFAPSDYIVHDYAIMVSGAGGQRQPIIIVPAGTRFPTAPDLWRRPLVPTCALGEPEQTFKLVISELGANRPGDKSFGWDAAGHLQTLDGHDGQRLIVPLNEANPTLGFLDPPHQPGDKRARLDVAFGVNEERWLIATVTDLLNNKRLMQAAPVVRLL